MTRGYRELQGDTGDHNRLHVVTRGYKGVTRGYRRLQGVTGGYNGLHGVTKGYSL